MHNKLVSICVPCYNAEKYLRETINCLIKQTYQNIEIIVVDDGSEDNSLEILQNAVDEDSRIKYFKQSHLGAASARNKAFGHSKGEYILFFDSDNIVLENYIQLLIIGIKNSVDKILAGQLRRFFKGNFNTAKAEPIETWQDLKPLDWLLIDNGKGLGMMQSSMFLLPRNFIEKAGLWNDQLSLIDDFEFFPRVLLQATEIVFVKEAIVYYRSGIENSLSNSYNLKAVSSAFKALKLTTKTIIDAEDSPRSRAVLANYWSLWAYHFYPISPRLLFEAEIIIKDLSGADFKPKFTGITGICSNIFGWQLTKKFKSYLHL